MGGGGLFFRPRTTTPPPSCSSGGGGGAGLRTTTPPPNNNPPHLVVSGSVFVSFRLSPFTCLRKAPFRSSSAPKGAFAHLLGCGHIGRRCCRLVPGPWRRHLPWGALHHCLYLGDLAGSSSRCSLTVPGSQNSLSLSQHSG